MIGPRTRIDHRLGLDGAFGEGFADDVHLLVGQGAHVVLELHAMLVQLVQDVLAASQAEFAG
jgi:hypothetical protein